MYLSKKAMNLSKIDVQEDISVLKFGGCLNIFLRI